MVVCLQKILVLYAVMIRVLGREVCTYVEERETEGALTDWQGYTSVRNMQQCKEFCSSTPGCSAAEYRSSSDSCVLYDGPTTRHKNTHSTFLHRICIEITSTAPPTASEPTTSEPIISQTTTSEPKASKPTTPEPSKSEQTTSKPTSEPTATTVDQVIRVSSTNHIVEMTTRNEMKEEEGEKYGKEMGRLRRSSSTEQASDQTVSMETTIGTPRPMKSRVPASLVVKMLYASSTDTPPSASKSDVTEETSTIPSISAEQPTLKPARRKKKKFRKRQSGKRRSRKDRAKFIHNSAIGGRHSHWRKSWTTTPPMRVSKRSTEDTTHAYTTTQKSSNLVEISKSIELTIPETAESLRIKPDKERKPGTLVRVHMRTSRYRQVPVSPLVEQNNRVAIPGGPRDKQTGRNCPLLCMPRNFVQHNSRGLLIPLMRIHIPFMTPYHGAHGQYPRFRHRFRFRLPIRQTFSQLPQMPYQRHSQYPQWQQPMRQPSWQQFRQQPQWQQHEPQHRQWRQSPRRQTSEQHSQWRHSRNFRGIGPQHAAVARYGERGNPWDNNFKRASLRTPRTHQVAVIPGARRMWVPEKRGQATGYTLTSAPITTTATTVEPATQTVSEYARSTDKGTVSNANLRYAIQNDRLNDDQISHRHATEMKVKTDERWQLKPHYNTYLLRLNLPLPITGYKLCYLRQQLPPPPKIIVISFKQDGSFKVKSLPVHYPRRTCTFVRPGAGPPELHLPAPLVIFTGVRFAWGQTELGGIYNATAPKAEYEKRRVQSKASMYRYTAVFNAAPVLRKLDLPIEIASAVVGFDSARMGFIYRFTVRLPRALSSRNIMLQERLPAHMLHVKIGPKPYVRNPK